MTNNEDLKSRLIALTRDLTMIPSTESRPQERKRCFELLHHHIDQLPSIQIDYYDCNEHRSMVGDLKGLKLLKFYFVDTWM